MRPPSGAWSWWNRRLFSSVAPYTRTGMVTSPKVIAPFQIVFIAPRGLLYESAAHGEGRHVEGGGSCSGTTVRGPAAQLKEAAVQVASRRRAAPPFPEPLPARKAGDAGRLAADGRLLRVSNLDKRYWPDDGYSKGDLLAYYWNVAELLLPPLRDRPLTMKRMPDGLAGEPFYEKQVPAHAPDWLPPAAVPSEDETRVVEFVVVQDLPTLEYVANLGCIEMHPLHSRAGSLDRPDYAFFDLDPFPPYTFADVRTVAMLVKVVLDGLGLRGYPKTSGATGMQVFVPLQPVHPYADVRAFVERVGRLVARAYPEKATMAWPVADRAGKVFIDHQMNRAGANIASVYSLRPLPGAPVSTPLDWDEVGADLEPGDFRIDNVWDRFALGDRFAGVLEDRQTLDAAMDALGLRPGSAAERERERRGGRPRYPRSASPRPREREALEEYAAKRDFARTPEPPDRDEAAAGDGAADWR